MQARSQRSVRESRTRRGDAGVFFGKSGRATKGRDSLARSNADAGLSTLGYAVSMEHAKSDRIVTITVSDTRTVADDESGRVLGELLKQAGFGVRRHHIIKDEPDYIRELVTQTSRSEAEAIVLTGGTGIAPRDHTYDVVHALLEKRIEGFGEAFRRLSWDEVGPHAILSRATAGTLNGTVVFC